MNNFVGEVELQAQISAYAYFYIAKQSKKRKKRKIQKQRNENFPPEERSKSLALRKLIFFSQDENKKKAEECHKSFN